MPSVSSVHEMQQVFNRLCQEYGIRAVTRPSQTGWADIVDGQRVIFVPKIRGYVTMSTATHEIGHIALGHLEGGRKPKLTHELESWGYVRRIFNENSWGWPTSVQMHAVACMANRLHDKDLKEQKAKTTGMAARVERALRTLEEVGIVDQRSTED